MTDQCAVIADVKKLLLVARTRPKSALFVMKCPGSEPHLPAVRGLHQSNSVQQLKNPTKQLRIPTYKGRNCQNFINIMEAKPNPASTNGDQRPPGPILHVRADSDTVMESMFTIALKPQGSEMPLQKPMRMRNLPPSFWKPPSSGSKSPSCHSRENR